MFQKILVANRGEIALRVIRSCRELGIPTVAVYSEADRNALHVRFADETVCIGPPQAQRSYLHIPSVLAAAEITGADAIHPGYGFLAENALFASAVEQGGRTFIGPSSEHIRLFGDKIAAKEAAAAAGVPMLGGSDGAVESVDEALAAAEVAGWPVMVKAAGGGGGKGMRVFADEAALRRGFEVARNEAQAAFGTGRVFVERFLVSPRHVEVQVLADGCGRAVTLGTRDCSLQRRHQKIIEEAPAPGLSAELEREIRGAAAALLASVGYRTVATVEFLVEDGAFYFLEVNPRIQVEHPVTEEISGVDLVAEQIRLAAGGPLPFTEDDVVLRGHAIEVRVNAEHPWTFRPSPGRVTGYHEPGGPGIRVDSAVHEHAVIPPYYDSLVAKVIAWGATREQARLRLLGALDEMVVEGVDTTLPLQEELLRGEAFREVRYSTKHVDRWLAERAGETD